MSVETVTNNKRNAFIAIAIIILLAVLRVIYLNFTFIDLAPDEAQYWLWSKYPDLSYYSKGPLVAWLLSISTYLLGDTILGVKFFAIIGMSIISWLSFLLARNWQGDKAGFYALALLNGTPLLGIGGLLMVPDIPVAVLWLFSLWLLTAKHRFFDGWSRFIIIGIAIGIAGLAKYTAGLFYPLVGIYFLVNKNRRMWLKKPHIYISGIISLACLAPIFIWNISNDYVGFKHVLGQIGGEGGTDWLDTFANFIGGQAGISGGFVFVFLIAYWLLGNFEKGEKGKIFWWFSAPLFAFFCFKALGAKVQPNWPVLSILVGFIGLSGWVTVRKQWVQNIFIVTLVISSGITFLVHDTQMLRYLGVNLSAKKDPLKPALGWHGLGSQITAELKNMPKNTVILTTRYQAASEFAFYVKDKNGNRPELLYINPGYRRQNQFDYWQWPSDMSKRVTLYINEANTLEPVVKNGFKNCTFLKELQSKRPNPNGGELILKQASLYKCTGYKGIKRTMADKF